MGVSKEILRPTKNKIILAIILFLVYFLIVFLFRGCPQIERLCSATVNTPGAIELSNGGYYSPGIVRSVPFSCKQVCTTSEYNSVLANTILFRFIIPFVIIYLISSLLFFRFNRLKKR